MSGDKSRSIARCQARRTMEANRTPRLRRTLARTLVALVVVETGWLSYPTVRARLLALEATPARRGQRLAVELGCFSCHGPGGGGGTKNPGSEEGTVPAFTERTQMMYVKTTDDLREYVLDGAPRRKREDPDYRAKVKKAALRMPSYRRFVTARQVDDLVAFLRAASGQLLPDEARAARGGEIAGDLGCFACHGPLGTGGVGNPGSLKGYGPGSRRASSRASPSTRSAAASSGARRSRCRPTSTSSPKRTWMRSPPTCAGSVAGAGGRSFNSQLFGAPSAIQERIVKVSAVVRQPPAGGKPGQPCGITAPPRGRPWPRIRCASWLPRMLPGFTRSSLPVVAGEF